MISFRYKSGMLPGNRKMVIMNIRNLPNQFTQWSTTTKVAIIAVAAAWGLFCGLIITAAFLLY